MKLPTLSLRHHKKKVPQTPELLGLRPLIADTFDYCEYEGLMLDALNAGQPYIVKDLLSRYQAEAPDRESAEMAAQLLTRWRTFFPDAPKEH